ncbi:MAG: LacI family DNA-binding transcriptional regulator [Nocardioidaceae bacterium]|nr:LacI family DNA-binding transcriptional regulator [Nocardioidaceae bacterium]
MTSVQPGSRSRPTIYDVAQRAGVSKSLVSLVLRGHPNVSDRRRRAVLEAIDELGYRPSTAAASLAGHRTHSIGVAIEEFENLWFVELLRGMRQELHATGYHVTVADRDLNSHLALDPIDGFRSLRVDGLVMAMEPGAGVLDDLDLPYVVAGQRENVPGTSDLVAGDDTLGGEMATGHLLGLGHERIAHVTGAGGTAALRCSGYEATMRAAGHRVVVVGHDEPTTELAAGRSTAALLDAEPDVTAVFAANDLMALGAMAALRERGLGVPGDVSVMGYDDTPLAGSAYLGLTSVDDRSDEMGVRTARTLLRRISDPSAPPHRELLEPAVVVRTTTAPGPRAARP